MLAYVLWFLVRGVACAATVDDSKAGQDLPSVVGIPQRPAEQFLCNFAVTHAHAPSKKFELAE